MADADAARDDEYDTNGNDDDNDDGDDDDANDCHAIVNCSAIVLHAARVPYHSNVSRHVHGRPPHDRCNASGESSRTFQMSKSQKHQDMGEPQN